MKIKENFNKIHLDYLRPLIKWRILNLETLRSEIVYQQKKYDRFRQIIRKFEQNKITDSFIDPYSNKKFIFLTSLGGRLINENGIQSSLSEETIFHDARAVEVIREILSYPGFEESKLEHEIESRHEFSRRTTFIPDGILTFEKGGEKARVVFELELSRKTKKRILEKLNRYTENIFYRFVFYFLPTLSLLTLFKELVGEVGGAQKIALFFLPSIYSRKLSFDEGLCHFNGKEHQIDEFLNQSVWESGREQEDSDAGNDTDSKASSPSKFLGIFDRRD